VANLDLVAICPGVPDLVPSRFCVAPLRGADIGFHQGDGSSGSGRGWDAGRAHLYNGELDVGDGFGECSIGGNPVIGGGVLLNGCVHQIFEGKCHLLCLFKFGGMICTKLHLAGSHAIDIAHLGKGGSPVGFPVGPSVVDDRVTFLLAPGQHHVATRQGMLGSCGDHVSLEMGTPEMAAKT
jgi:hypothetical protein